MMLMHWYSTAGRKFLEELTARRWTNSSHVIKAPKISLGLAAPSASRVRTEGFPTGSDHFGGAGSDATFYSRHML